MNGRLPILISLLAGVLASAALPAQQQEKLYLGPLNVDPPHISTDKSVKYDYDIVYVRAPRTVKTSDGKERQALVWPNAAEPENLKASTDLMLLHPDGSEEVLVAGGPGSVTDPMVSFDGEWVYYSLFHNLKGALVTQSVPAQVIARSGGAPGRVARVQAVGPPVGLLEVTTRPPAPTSTHWVVLWQATANSAFAFGILVGVKELGPAPGLVLVQTPPL